VRRDTTSLLELSETRNPMRRLQAIFQVYRPSGDLGKEKATTNGIESASNPLSEFLALSFLNQGWRGTREGASQRTRSFRIGLTVERRLERLPTRIRISDPHPACFILCFSPKRGLSRMTGNCRPQNIHGYDNEPGGRLGHVLILHTQQAWPQPGFRRRSRVLVSRSCQLE
jgi:hypothetical protein